MDRNERIAAEEEKANTSIEVERIKNEKILKQAELKMEAKRAKRIANETDEQREARLLDEERINKKKEDDDIRKRLLSGDIYFAINKQLALFAIDRRQFDDVKEIIEYLNEMDFILTKFSLSKDEDGKGRLTEDMNLALTRYQSVLNMLSSIDPLNPMYADYEAKRNNYSKSLKNAEKTTRTIERKRYISKKFLIAMRMTAAGLFVASFFVDNIAGMVCRGAAFWWCIFDLFIRKKN